jgi:hypothetical protein
LRGSAKTFRIEKGMQFLENVPCRHRISSTGSAVSNCGILADYRARGMRTVKSDSPEFATGDRFAGLAPAAARSVAAIDLAPSRRYRMILSRNGWPL